MCSDIPQPSYWLQSVIVGNNLYLLGGYSNHDTPSPVVFTTPLDTLSTHQLKLDGVNSTQLMIMGGDEELTATRTSDIYKLNKVSHSWEAIGQIPSARSSSAAVSTLDDRVIVIGGSNNKEEYINTVWIGSYEPQ